MLGSKQVESRLHFARTVTILEVAFENLNNKKTESGVTETNTYSESGDMSSLSVPTVGKDVFAENPLRHLKKPATAKV